MAEKRQVSRRELLKRAGGAAAGAGIAVGVPAIIPARVLGADGIPAPSERIRLGFIGVKNRGMQNLAPLMKYAVAVCDVDKNVLAAAKAAVEKANGQCAAYTDYRKLLEAKDIDAVVISTPDHWHALQTIDACAAGKDVFCEKPLTLTIHEGQAMIKAARKYKRIVQTGSQQRSDDKFRLACELVRSGRLGKIHLVRVGIPRVNFKEPPRPNTEPPAELDYDMWLGPAPYRPYNQNHVHYNFRFFWDFSGGQQTNFGAHHLDIAQWGLGMDESGPVSAQGTAEYDPEKRFEVPSMYEVEYTYANGVKLLCGMAQRGGVTFEGEKGTIFVTRGKIESTPPEILMEPLLDSDVHLYASKNHYQNWLDCIKSRKLPICDVAIGHRSATVCHLGNIAIRSGRKVQWDPKAEKVIGDKEQAKMTRYEYRSPWKLSV
jgi:predicted dehydrogenase